MRITRAIGFGAMLYLFSFLSYGISLLFVSEQASTSTPSLGAYIVTWVVNIPVVLLLAKWYFRHAVATLKTGVLLGGIAIIIAFLLDGLMIVASLVAGGSIESFGALYTDWKFYVTLVQILLLTAYAGYEFDGTYTDVSSISSKE